MINLRLTYEEMHHILRRGQEAGYFKFKDPNGEGTRFLLLEVEKILLNRAHEELVWEWYEQQHEIRGKEIRSKG